MNKPAQWQFDKNRVDPSWSWFWEGGTWCLPMWENQGTILADIGNLNAPASFPNGDKNPQWSTDENGVTLYFDNSYAELVTPMGFGTLMELGSFTLYAVIRPTDVHPSPPRTQVILGDHDVDKKFDSIVIQEDSDRSYFMGNCGYGEQQRPDSLSTDDNGTLKVMVLTWDMPYRRMTVRINNKHVGMSPEAFMEFPQLSGNSLVLGRPGRCDNYYYTGHMSLVGAHKGVAWTDAQVVQFSNNPFGCITEV